MWKDIKGFDNYEVSDTGAVRSLTRRVWDEYHQCWSLRKGAALAIIDNGKGYKYVSLWRDGKEYKRYVHRLVADAFIPNPDDLPVVHHRDHNRGRNHADNLKWTTVLDNNRLSSKKSKRKITRAQADQIRAEWAAAPDPKQYKDFAGTWGISPENYGRVIRKQIWN